MTVTSWQRASVLAGCAPRSAASHAGLADAVCSLAAIVALLMAFAQVWVLPAVQPTDEPRESAPVLQDGSDRPARSANETLIAGYIGAPFYYRSDVHLVRPDDTDVTLRRLGWDGDALHFPIDGGVRALRWGSTFGFMVDFLHNKAVSRLGKGAHGRKLANPVIEDVAADGIIKGQPAPAQVKLTDVFERLEFTHGHNMLFATAMMRTAAPYPGVRPYFGLGGGVALPHVEVWFPGQPRDKRTNEYQYAGPAWQFVAGLEFRSGKFSYFLEYKFSYAWIAGALTGDESWKNFNMPGDLLRQILRWWSGDPPSEGRISTTLAAHQVLVGGGYWWQGSP